jgi:hypothetical protein
VFYKSSFFQILLWLLLIYASYGYNGTPTKYDSAISPEQANTRVFESLPTNPVNIRPVQSLDGEILCRNYLQTFDSDPGLQSFKKLPPVNGLMGYQEVISTFSELICNPDSPVHYSKILGIAFSGGEPSGSRLVAYKNEDGVVDLFAAYSSTLPGRKANEYAYGVLCAMTDPALFTLAMGGRYPASLKKTTLLSVGPENDRNGMPTSFRTKMQGKRVLIFSGFQIESEVRLVTIEAEGKIIPIIISAEAKEINMMEWMLQIKFGLTDVSGKSYGLVYNRVRIGTSFHDIALRRYTGSIDEELQIMFETTPTEDPEQIKRAWKAHMQSIQE